MKIQQFTNRITLLLLSCAVMLSSATLQAQNESKYVCDEAQPENTCNAANTCGSVSAPCTIDITKGGKLSNVKRGIPNAKNNPFFCIKTGTTVVWMTSNKNTGFMISFGTDSPFDPDDPILGGANKQVTVKASAPGPGPVRAAERPKNVAGFTKKNVVLKGKNNEGSRTSGRLQPWKSCGINPGIARS